MSPSPRQVRLRILREGPTHNHLLSPLTPYLAVVGRHQAASLHVPYEHRRLMRDLAALRYGATARSAPDVSSISASDRRLIADDVSKIFSSVPGLASELGTGSDCHPELVHLELAFSASELSLLPFELATSPTGFPGPGLPLSIQVSTPIVMTRTIPGATGRTCPWAGKPKILFAWASPPNMDEVPHRAHLAALVSALAPWTGPLNELQDLLELRKERGEKEQLTKAVGEFLTVVPRASRGQIERLCRAECFTHVHILAHSTVVENDAEPHYALALHDESGGVELVNPERLQAALRLPLERPDRERTLSHPIVVSLATCDSGNQAQVIFPNMSLAHAVHAAGVPLVVGSLFPITFRGSVVMTEGLYTGLLRGRDPRWVLYDTRHALFRSNERAHDWASMVAYASFPDDVAEQSADMGYLAACAAIDARLKLSDAVIAEMEHVSGDRDREPLRQQLDRLDTDIVKAEADLPRDQAYVVEGQGMKASAEKCRAGLLYRAANMLPQSRARDELLKRSAQALREAQAIYLHTASAPPWRIKRPALDEVKLPTLHWVLTQALSLSFVLNRSLDRNFWDAAVGHARTLLPIRHGEFTAEGVWAHGSLAELFLIAHGMFDPPGTTAQEWEGQPPWPAKSDEQAKIHIEQFVTLANQTNEPFYVRSTRRQLERYTTWWLQDDFVKACGLADAIGDDVRGARVRDLAEELISMLAG